MSAPSDQRLMELYDDELGPEEAAELEQRLADDPDAAAVVRGLEQVGSVLREAAEADGALADDIAVRVMACIEAEESASSMGAPTGAGEAPGGVLVTGRWRHAVPVVAGVLALAAAALLVARWGAPTHRSVIEGATAHPSAQAMQPRHVDKPAAGATKAKPGGAVAADSPPPVAIETVDFGSHDGAIFMVSAGSDSTPVVWLTDEPAAAGGRTKPL